MHQQGKGLWSRYYQRLEESRWFHCTFAISSLLFELNGKKPGTARNDLKPWSHHLAGMPITLARLMSSITDDNRSSNKMLRIGLHQILHAGGSCQRPVTGPPMARKRQKTQDDISSEQNVQLDGPANRILHPDLLEETSSIGALYKEAVQRRNRIESSAGMATKLDSDTSSTEQPDVGGQAQEVIGRTILFPHFTANHMWPEEVIAALQQGFPNIGIRVAQQCSEAL